MYLVNRAILAFYHEHATNSCGNLFRPVRLHDVWTSATLTAGCDGIYPDFSVSIVFDDHWSWPSSSVGARCMSFRATLSVTR